MLLTSPALAVEAKATRRSEHGYHGLCDIRGAATSGRSKSEFDVGGAVGDDEGFSCRRPCRTVVRHLARCLIRRKLFAHKLAALRRGRFPFVRSGPARAQTLVLAGGCPTVSSRAVSTASIKVDSWAAKNAAPDDHLAAGQNRGVRVTCRGGVDCAYRGPAIAGRVVFAAGIPVVERRIDAASDACLEGDAHEDAVRAIVMVPKRSSGGRFKPNPCQIQTPLFFSAIPSRDRIRLLKAFVFSGILVPRSPDQPRYTE